MKKNLIVLLVCMIFFTGCSSLCITSNAMSSDESIVQAYTVSLEKSNLRTYIDVYESRLLFLGCRDSREPSRHGRWFIMC